MGFRVQVLAMVMGAGLLAACGTTPNVGDSVDREALHYRAQATLNDFKAADSSLNNMLSSAHAYVIFPEIISGAAGLGGAYGHGEVYQKGAFVGYADVSQASIGLQLGGQKFGELIVFRNERTFAGFTSANYEMDAKASAVAASNGAATSADYSKGVLVFTLPESGLMAQAALGVQKFRYTASARP